MTTRILHSVSNMDRGGIETMLMNYYRHIDRDGVQFDFLCNKNVPGAYDEEIRQMGGRLFVTPGLNPLKFPAYLRYMEALFREHPDGDSDGWRIIHVHNGAFGVYALYAARRAGKGALRPATEGALRPATEGTLRPATVPHRIFHAHGAGHTVDFKLPWKWFCKSQLLKNANHNWACGKAAAEYYFGRKNFLAGNYMLIRNAIDVNRFKYKEEIRQRIRRQYGLEGKHVVGHVGRFAKQKNHRFLVNAFRALVAGDESESGALRPATFLVLLGDGELLDSVRWQVQQAGLQNRVLFAGSVENTHEWYQAFDLFLLPSRFEGLPVTGIEAQAAGLPCLFSDNVTPEVRISRQVTFLSLKQPLEEWADAMRNLLFIGERHDDSAMITAAGYNIEVEAKKLQDLYLSMAGDATP